MEGMTSFLPIILMFAVIYFLMIRPQQKKVKQEKAFEAALKVGDRVVTKSGIHGRIGEIQETTIILETMAGKLQIEKVAISMDFSAKLNEKK
ncbi:MULTISPECIES: preprotein translocase subunit YajC [Myroides]|uniref:Sec translocon accessory complex subunit YajC n=1 Tax=Myroides albus TaxID=2562892 RepID=A0A6I3LHI8_9FLAO|nr:MULTISPECIES: preprotein translocase subunit YajC [Myroides]MTG97703.1 preprotein translocase subunit YajC [Myroides albus]MVX34653.1 preprotein translocase subunit YajC [Myroides sp. LoEW2-1]UVD78751.1 preprotein translocase subunit YajC [Myroides albus]